MFKKLLSFFKKDKKEEPSPNKYTVPGQAKADIPAAGVGLATGATISNNPNLNSSATDSDPTKTANVFAPNDGASTGPGLEDESSDTPSTAPQSDAPSTPGETDVTPQEPTSAPEQPATDGESPAEPVQEPTVPSTEPEDSTDQPQDQPEDDNDDPNKDAGGTAGPTFS